MIIERLKKRPDFQKVTRKGGKFVAPSLIVLALKRNNLQSNVSEDVVRLGFTVSKKVGNAVCRNRVRRRFKEAANKVMPEFAILGCDYVIIGRKATLDKDFDTILSDLQRALPYLAKKLKQ
ncbi:MAG: ribonuclease P protein component [Alphaproteobacteria bacterium]|nr:ribonuclease P protein component [Alphaproteobacteria bacterium]